MELTAGSVVSARPVDDDRAIAIDTDDEPDELLPFDEGEPGGGKR